MRIKGYFLSLFISFLFQFLISICKGDFQFYSFQSINSWYLLFCQLFLLLLFYFCFDFQNLIFKIPFLGTYLIKCPFQIICCSLPVQTKSLVQAGSLPLCSLLDHRHSGTASEGRRLPLNHRSLSPYPLPCIHPLQFMRQSSSIHYQDHYFY